MKPPPGYKRIAVTQAITYESWDYQDDKRYREHVKRSIPRLAGSLLTQALEAGDMIQGAPIFFDADQRRNPLTNCIEVQLTLDYMAQETVIQSNIDIYEGELNGRQHEVDGHGRAALGREGGQRAINP